MNAIPVHSLPKLDPARITANAGVIAVHAAAILLLLVPIAVPPRLDLAIEPEPTVIFVKPPVAPDPPLRVPVTRRPPEPRPTPAPRTVRDPVPDVPLLVTDPQPGDVQVDPPADTPTGPTGPVLPVDAGEPLQGARLEYAAAPPPSYPPEALRRELQGTVMLEVLVDVDGRPLEVTVSRSSGHRVLDLAARRQVLSTWRFRPAMRDGRPVQAIGLVPVEFALDR